MNGGLLVLARNLQHIPAARVPSPKLLHCVRSAYGSHSQAPFPSLSQHSIVIKSDPIGTANSPSSDIHYTGALPCVLCFPLKIMKVSWPFVPFCVISIIHTFTD